MTTTRQTWYGIVWPDGQVSAAMWTVPELVRGMAVERRGEEVVRVGRVFLVTLDVDGEGKVSLAPKEQP